MKVSNAGKVTVKKGARKGTYSLKVKVTAAGNANYKAKSKTVTLKVRVTAGKSATGSSRLKAASLG